MRYKTERNGNLITIWDEKEGIGMQFKKGESLQRYVSEVVLKETSILSTEEGIAKVSKTQEELTAYAEEHYPQEFGEIK